MIRSDQDASEEERPQIPGCAASAAVLTFRHLKEACTQPLGKGLSYETKEIANRSGHEKNEPIARAP